MSAEFNITLDELYQHIDAVQDELQSSPLWDSTTEVATRGDLGALWEVLSQIFGASTVYGTDAPQMLGVNATILNKFLKGSAPISKRMARVLAERTLTFLRSIEGQLAGSKEDSDAPAVVVTTTPMPAQKPEQPVSFPGSIWKLVPADSVVKAKIAYLSELLEQLIARVRGSNLPDGAAALTQIERQQLIAILETALKVLKAPMVEKGILKKAMETLGGVLKRVATKEAEEGLSDLADTARDTIGVVLKDIF